MSEELIQRNLIDAPEKMGEWNYYNIGATTLKALKAAKIIPDRDYDEYEGKKPDALIVKKPMVIAAIEYKTPVQLRTPKQIAKAIAQEIGTAQALQARVYIVTDGKKSFWINPLTGNEILQEDGSKITLNFDKGNTDCITLINKIRASISTSNDTIKAATIVDPLPLAEKVWQDLWAVSGATPENCLYTFVEIFIYKYLSDLGVLKGMYSFYNLLGQYSGNNENEILEFYASTVRVKIKELFPGNPKDKTTIINGTIFVSKDDKAVSGYATVFHRILKRFNDFGTLENIDYDFKSKLFETFLKESISKKNWGQYFTPLKVVRAIVNMVDITAGMEICDPACGVGKFLLEPILHNLDKLYEVGVDSEGKDLLIPKITLSGFDKGFDKDEQKTIILAKANMLIYMSGLIKDHPGITTQFADLFNETFLLQTNSILGTLAKPIKDKYDLILTNPPYVMSGSSNLKEEIAKDDTLKKYFAVSAMGIEGLFMEWIVRALKPGGKAFIVVPDGIMSRSNDKKLRDFILDQCCIDAVISLPLNTFFTTNKKTYILVLTKKVPVTVGGVPTLKRQETPVFTYLCSEIGESRDVYRFDIEQNDLENASDLFNMFKGAKTKFKTTDKRCKIVCIDDFYCGAHWAIDRWWTREEKIELGVEDEVETITLSGFASLIADVSSSLMEYQEPLYELEKKKTIAQYRTVNLIDSTLFSLISSGIGLNRTKLNLLDTHDTTDIPVYTASQVPVVYIKELANKKPIFASAANPLLSFATNGDGSAGRNFVIHDRPFYINTDRLAVKSINKDISVEYVRVMLIDMKRRYGFNHAHKANRHNLSVVNFTVPINSDGTFDTARQQVVVETASYLEELCKSVDNQKQRVINAKVSIDLSEYQFIYKKVIDLFSVLRGSGVYTKDYTQKHEGSVPLFSGNTAGPFAYVDTADYNVSCLSWVIDGLAGYIMAHSTAFSATNHRGILLPKTSEIDLQYARFVLEPIFRSAKKGRVGENGENEYTSLPPFMVQTLQIPVPVDSEGKISLSAQNEIAEKYLTIEQCRQDVVSKLDGLISQKLSI